MIQRAGTYVALLLRLFSTIFRTLPKENFFAGFRPETGGSSAIQSRNYQRLDRIVRGFGREKSDELRKHPSIADLPDSDHPACLLAALRTASADANRWSLVEQQRLAYHLDQIEAQFAAWRSFHLGIARDYLPAEAVGSGGMGIGYLQRTLHADRRDARAPQPGAASTVREPAYWITLDDDTPASGTRRICSAPHCARR